MGALTSSPAAGLRALADLLDRLDAPVTRAGLHEYVGSSAERAAAFAGSIWGSIRWSRDLGLPEVDPVARAFTVHQEVHLDIVYVDEQGHIDHWVTWDFGSAAVWEGPHDDAHYRVTYYSPASSPEGATVMRASLTPVRWPRTRVGGGMRRIVPPQHQFDWTGEGPVVLPEQELVQDAATSGGSLGRRPWAADRDR